MPEGNNAPLFAFDDFFDNALSGYVITNDEGIILRANNKLAEWIGLPAEQLVGQRFSQLFTIGGKIYYETHLRPLLNLQGFFDEVALEHARPPRA